MSSEEETSIVAVLSNFVALTVVVLTSVLMILKATGVVDWSWFWVTSPLWIAIVLYWLTMLAVLVWAGREFLRRDR